MMRRDPVGRRIIQHLRTGPFGGSPGKRRDRLDGLFPEVPAVRPDL